MNKNLINVILKIVIIVICIMLIKPNNSSAFSLTEILESGDNFINVGKQEEKNGIEVDQSNLKVISNEIYNALLGIGIILSVLLGAILGIKIMFGSIEEQTKAKESLIPYIVGCAVIFGAFGIWKIVVTILSQI